jgi:DNA-binding transcriptional MerR regulator
MKKSPDAFRTISEVADWLGTPTHVLRFWESRFNQVKPVKRAGGRRYYRPTDMELLGGIKKLLHNDGMTIRGVQKLLREEGVRHVAALSPPIDQTGVIDGTSSTVDDIAKIAHPLADEAPIDLNVIPEPLENVVQMNQAAPVVEIEDADTDAEEFELAQAEADPAPAKPEPAPATFKAADEPSVGEPEKIDTAEQASEPEPTPILADVPDDPEDDDASVPGITDVAASLRAASTSSAKPSPEVISELYNRLIGLRDRMDDRADTDSTD